MTNLNHANDDSFDPFSPEARAASLVDSIGQMKAGIAGALATIKTLEAALKDMGPGRYKGAAYEATVSTHERSSLDMEAVRAKLSPQFIRANTSTSEVTVLKVTARVLG